MRSGPLLTYKATRTGAPQVRLGVGQVLSCCQRHCRPIKLRVTPRPSQTRLSEKLGIQEALAKAGVGLSHGCRRASVLRRRSEPLGEAVFQRVRGGAEPWEIWRASRVLGGPPSPVCSLCVRGCGVSPQAGSAALGRWGSWTQAQAGGGENIAARRARHRDGGKIKGSDLTSAVQGAIFRSHEGN